MWVAAAFVLFAPGGCVVSVGGGVGSGSVFGHWIGDDDVDVVGVGVVVAYNVEDGTFLLWGAWLSV